MRSSQAITNFASGEVTPALAGRIDTDQYPQFVRKMENCVVEKHGGAKGRGGTHFAGEAKKSKVRLIPFVFSREESYMLEFGHRYVRFFRGNGQVTNPEREHSYYATSIFGQEHPYHYGSDHSEFDGDGVTTVFTYDFDDAAFPTIKVWENASLKVGGGTDYTLDTGVNTITFVTAPADGITITVRGFISNPLDVDLYINDALKVYTTDYTWFYEIVGMYPSLSLVVGDNVKYEIPAAGDTENYIPEINGASQPDYFLEIETDIDEDQLDGLYWAQANDVMVMCHYKNLPMTLTRYGELFWQITFDDYFGAPWEKAATNWVGDGSKTVFKTIFTFISSADVAAYENGVSASPTVSVPNQEVTFSTAPALGVQIILQLNDATLLLTATQESLQPRCVTFFQERLYFGGSLSQPQTIWGSRTADFNNFCVPDTANGQELVPDSPVEYTIAAYTHEAIEWFSAERVLIIGTSSTEHRLAPDEYIATDRVPQVSKMTDFGGSHQMPMYMGGLTCFVQRAGNQIRSFKQSSSTVIEEYESINLNWMASHMTEEYWLKEPSYALTPDCVAWMVREDGQLMTAMYDPSSGQMDIKEIGWSRQITDGDFKSLNVIPVTFKDQVWIAVERTIDSETKIFIEYVNPDIHLDSGLTYSGSAVSAITNLDHLEGETVTIVGDGLVQDDKTVVSGAITLDTAASEISIGMPFVKKVHTMPFVGGNNQGTGKGRLGRWSEIFVELYKSSRPKVNGQIPKNVSREELHSESIRVFNLGYDREKIIEIEQDKPLPLHLVSLYGIHNVSNG